MTFNLQGSKVVIPLQVQLAGEDRWFRVNIGCPLIKRYSERTRLIPTREWRQLTDTAMSSLFGTFSLEPSGEFSNIFTHK